MLVRYTICTFALITALIASSCGVTQAATEFFAELSPAQVVAKNGAASPDGVSSASGTATLSLNDTQDQLSYMITFSGIDLDGLQTSDPNDDATGLHLHVGAAGTNGPHTLNILAAPSEDDDDLIVDPVAGTLQGIWDDSDVVASPPFSPGDTKPLSDFINDLLAGNLYFQLHTTGFPAPDTGELRGQVVPEPTALALLGTVAVIGVSKRRRRRHQRMSA